MNRALCSLWLVCLAVTFAGCGGSEYSGDRRFPLSGNVTYDGEPIERGSISFLPQEGDKQRVSGGVIENGTYTVPEAKGANAGKYRVEIRWAKLTGRKITDDATGEVIDERVEGLPTKFHEASELTVEVDENHTTFDFDLKSN